MVIYGRLHWDLSSILWGISCSLRWLFLSCISFPGVWNQLVRRGPKHGPHFTLIILTNVTVIPLTENIYVTCNADSSTVFSGRHPMIINYSLQHSFIKTIIYSFKIIQRFQAMNTDFRLILKIEKEVCAKNIFR